MKLGISVARPNLVSLGTCLGKFSKSGKFKLYITSLDYLAQYAKYKVWIKPNGEMPFLYGNHILKAHLGRITEDTPEHQGVVVYSMNDVPLGFGVTSRSTVDTRKLDPTAIVVFHQALSGMSGSTSVTSCPLLSMTSNEKDLCQKWIDISDDHLESSTIDDTLGPITDDLWVVAAIADRIIDNSTLLTDLLAVALKRSEGTVERLRASFVLQDDCETSDFDGQSPSSLDDDMVSYFSENSSDARMCLLRSLLLDRKDRLDSFLEMSAASVETPVESDDPEWDDPWLDSVDTESERQSDPGAPPLPLSAFLTQTLIDSAHLLATRGSLGPLQVLFKRHGPALWPFRLSILACVPDHVPPSLYQDILPKLDTSRDVEHQSRAETWRQVDWTEHPRVQAALLTSGYATSQTQGPVDQVSRPMLSQELSAWYQRRAHSILTSTGMVDTALLMIQHATSQDIPGLDELGEELVLLSRLVYDAQSAAKDGPEEDWTLEQWKSMDSLAVVRAMLALSTPESLIADIRKFVLPYLFVLESRAERAGDSSSGISSQLLSNFILEAPLEMVARIFEESKPTLPPGQRLIADDETMARLALACLYGSDSLGEWHVMSQIFECLPAWNVSTSDEDEDEVETTIASLGSFVTPTTTRPKCTPSDLFLFFRPLPLLSLSRALDILDVHLESGEILSRWDAPAPLRWFLQSANDKSSQRARAVRMARQLSATHALRSRDDWEWLLEDMLKLSRTNDNGLRSAFGLLSQADILSIFLSGLLSTGQLQIAESLLRSKKSTLSLDDRAVEDICLTSSREFYDNASSGNYTFGEMKLAYDCLSIPSRSERVIREQEFIEATSRITSFNVESRPGVPLTPIEIRLTKDRLTLISRVLSSNSDAYKYKEVILELVDKLGFRGDVVARAKTLAMIADTALQAEDFAQAFETSEAMINTVSQLCLSPGVSEEQLRDAKEVCWVSCFQLGRQTEFSDVPKKLRLLGHALEFCPADRLPEILAAWRRLEKEDIAAQQHASDDKDTTRRRGRAAAASAQYGQVVPTLASRLQNIHLPTSPLVMADGAAIADTFNRVASKFPFAKSRPQAHADRPEGDDDGPDSSRGDGAGWPSLGREEVSAQASKALQKGIGWLIGADE
ncbi:secretory pathway protein Sec39-domain-containing protein [Lactarius indigo]|nr:secretory pathway protein Sec39-domain-containing protein [Lactarius indigo]